VELAAALKRGTHFQRLAVLPRRRLYLGHAVAKRTGHPLNQRIGKFLAWDHLRCYPHQPDCAWPHS
jgi:hypothetical protein